MRRLAVALAVAATAMFISPATAHLSDAPDLAAGSRSIAPGGPCSGSRIDSHWLNRPNGNHMGRVRLFAGGGGKCAFIRNRTPNSATGRIAIRLCQQTRPGHGCNVIAVSTTGGTFAGALGPVTVSGGRCVKVHAQMTAANGDHDSRTWGPYHCG